MARIALRFNVLLLTLVAIFAATGCGGGAAADGFKGERGQVSGTVTVDGQPLKKGCQVLFFSEKGGYSAGGAVDGGGKYTLNYSKGGGLPTGDYLVQLTAPVVLGSKEVVDPSMMAAKMNVGKIQGGGITDSGPFPSKYSSTTTSTLQFKVGPKQNTADFKLEAK